MKITKEVMLRGLKAHTDFMNAARTHHLLWADGADDVETTELHLEAAKALAQIRLQLDRLVKKYREPST